MMRSVRAASRLLPNKTFNSISTQQCIVAATVAASLANPQQSKRRFASSSAAAVATAAQPSTSALTSAATAAAAASNSNVERTAAPVYTPSLWDTVFNRSKYPRTPLNQSFPGAPSLAEADIAAAVASSSGSIVTAPAKKPVAQVTKLANGMRVATKANAVASPVASVGVFIDAGSRYDTVTGLSHFHELMALKSTKNRSDFRLVRELQKMGADLQAGSTRDHLFYHAQCLQEYVPAMVANIGDLMQDHSFRLEEVLEQRELWEHDAEERSKVPEMRMSEMIHEAAYLNNTIGLPIFSPVHNLELFTPEAMKEYQRTYFTPERIVISGVGIEHQHLINLVEAVFTNLPDNSAAPPREKAHYTGGDVRHHVKGDPGLAHVAIGFECPSWHDKDVVAASVLAILMGGGGSFSAGGPGKGMYSRLYSRVLNQYAFVESLIADKTVHDDGGIFYLYGTTLPEHGKQLVDLMVKELVNMTGPVEADELARSKAQLASSCLMAVESRPAQLEDMGRNIMTYGRIIPDDELLASIAKVTVQDIQRVAKKMIASPMSLAASGDLSFVPRYDIIQAQFK